MGGKAHSDDLIGHSVLVPARVWPDIKPPKGKSGWEGHVKSLKSKSPEEYYVKFHGDPANYFFAGKDLRSWLLPEDSKAGSSEAKPSGAAKAAGAASGGKKRVAEDRPSGSGKASPSKKEKPLGSAAPAGLSKLLPPKPPAPQSPAKSGGRASPVKGPKATKESLLASLDKLMHRMDVEQMTQLVQDAERILS